MIQGREHKSGNNLLWPLLYDSIEDQVGPPAYHVTFAQTWIAGFS
jgi:hypothetical protein